jgi:2,4-dienoyl-CoA reductase-like NADH-dependent reductase (Old Yellow Enzyme family)
MPYLGLRPGDLDGKSYARHWRPDMAPLSADVCEVLLGPEAGELGLRLDDCNRLLDPLYLPLETGWTRLRNRQVFVAVRTPDAGGDTRDDRLVVRLARSRSAALLGFRLVGRRFLREYPFEEAFFRPCARQFLAALDLPLILLGGIDRLDKIEEALAEGFAFVAMARALLREPDLPNRVREGRARSGLCIHCNECMPTIYSGTRCVLVEGGPH